MKRALTFGALLMMLASALPADAQNVTKNSVKLKDGTVIRGQVQRTENGVNVTTEEGLFVYSNDELLLTKVDRWGKPHGFQASFGGGFHYSTGMFTSSGGPEILLGYRFNSFFVGLGAGYNFGEGKIVRDYQDYHYDYYKEKMWTLYFQSHYYFRNSSKFQPYVGMTLGLVAYKGDMTYHNHKYEDYDWYNEDKFNLLFRGLFGFEYRFAKSVSFNMAVGPGYELNNYSGFALTAHVGLTFCASK
jgi:hypothetical protein